MHLAAAPPVMAVLAFTVVIRGSPSLYDRSIQQFRDGGSLASLNNDLITVERPSPQEAESDRDQWPNARFVSQRQSGDPQLGEGGRGEPGMRLGGRDSRI